MGYNTAALFLNDAMGNLKTDPDIGRKIHDAILLSQYSQYAKCGVDFSIGNHCNGGMVLPSHHADEVQIVAIGGNYMQSMGTLYGAWKNMQHPEKLLKELADTMGYRLTKVSK